MGSPRSSGCARSGRAGSASRSDRCPVGDGAVAVILETGGGAGAGRASSQMAMASARGLHRVSNGSEDTCSSGYLGHQAQLQTVGVIAVLNWGGIVGAGVLAEEDVGDGAQRRAPADGTGSGLAPVVSRWGSLVVVPTCQGSSAHPGR